MSGSVQTAISVLRGEGCGGRDNRRRRRFAYGEEKRRLLASLTTCHLFERAVENIERYVVFAGIAELFEESIFAVAHLCGIPRVPAWRKDERNAGRPMASTLSDSTIELLQDHYRYDFELYAWAKKRFETLLSQMRIGGEIGAYRGECVDQYKDRLLTDDQSKPAQEIGQS